jgi:hypothetical protein
MNLLEAQVSKSLNPLKVFQQKIFPGQKNRSFNKAPLKNMKKVKVQKKVFFAEKTETHYFKNKSFFFRLLPSG